MIKNEHLLGLFVLLLGVYNTMQHGFHSCIAWNIHHQTTKLEPLWISGRRHAPERPKYATVTHFYSFLVSQKGQK